MFDHILVATDGSEIASKAVAEGIRLADALKSRLTFLTIMEPLIGLGDRRHAFAGMPDDARKQALDYLDAEARSTLERARQTAAAQGVAAATSMIEADEAYEAIIRTATSVGADLVVMGSHGRRGIRALLLGSVTQNVLTHSKVPVLVVR